MTDAADSHLSRDAFFGGQLSLLQRRDGHRAGTDAVLLMACAGEGHHVVDLGAGSGIIGLSLLALRRFQSAQLIEREPEMAALATRNAALNGLADRATVVEADVGAKAAAHLALGLAAHSADLVISNPPYNTPGRERSSPDPLRAAAHDMPREAFATWLRTAARLVSSRGRVLMIARADAITWLPALFEARFGDVAILPVQMAADQPARRLIIGAKANSKAPARVLPALVVHEADGSFTPAAREWHAGTARTNLWA